MSTRRRLPILGAILASLVARITPAHAQYPFGQEVAAFPVQAARLLADPVRARMYATQPAAGTVSVVETATLRISAVIPVGEHATELALSADASRLYVATGSYNKPGRVAVIDLDTLQVLPGFPLPQTPGSMVAGLAGRLYVAAAAPGTQLYQIDTATGAFQTIVGGPKYSEGGLLRVSPSAQTLYVAAGTLLAYDVSTPTAAFESAGTRTIENAPDFQISHDGKSLVIPCELNGAYTGVDAFFAEDDFDAVVGVYDDNNSYGSPAPLAFSADDTLLYTYQDDGSNLAAVATSTFTAAAKVGLGRLGTFGNAVTSLAVDPTGSYLFLGRNDPDLATTSPGLLVLSTGRGTPPLPVIKVQALETHIPSGGQGRFVVSREGDLSHDVTVRYGVGGYGHNTAAYPLKGIRVLKAGRAKAGFSVFGTGVGFGEVWISLLDDPTYTPAKKRNVRIVIDPAPSPTP